MDYRNIIKTRQTKRDLPLIGRLRKTIDIDAAKKQILGLISANEEKIKRHNLELDPSSTEHTYNLQNKRGEMFIKNYEETYKLYSAIGFHEMTDAAKLAASQISKPVSGFSPVERLKGMLDTSGPFYHPAFDERNYTKPTEHMSGYIQDFCDSFESDACRSAVVSLLPGKFISPHFDIGPEFITRLQIPIVTNEKAVIGVKTAGGWNEYHLPADGSIFFINAGWEHWAINGGDEIRYQLRVCLMSQEDLKDIEDYKPVRFISDAEFVLHPCSGNQPSSNNVTLQTLHEIDMDRSGKARLD